ncbi:ATP-binding protein [Microbacterium sp. NPDC055910]|uniref:ATP-binding protein n=1 Tax=Microbacterium sp. NPDC055910 TaxID=3345659 RepID=UPI0035E1B977
MISVDVDADEAWVELVSGGMVHYSVDDLPGDEGSLVSVGMRSGNLLGAPPDTVWPRTARNVGTLKHIGDERILMEFAGAIRALGVEDVVEPRVDAGYVFDDTQQRWCPLTDEESAVIIQIDEVISPFNVESYTAEPQAAAEYGGMRETVDELIRLLEANFRSRAEMVGRSDRPKPPAGAVFFGPPGTGKTHLARTVAKSLGSDLITVNGPELMDKYLGSTERAFRSLFSLAREKPRSIIFIDEFDTIGSRRGPDVHEAINRQVGQLLSLMDGAAYATKPFVIAATNRLEDVDPAFLRPGRFDFPVEFRLPTLQGRLEILHAQAVTVQIGDPACLPWLAASSNGWSPAELALIWTEADGWRTAEGRSDLTLEDIVRGYERARDQHSVVLRANDSVKTRGM